MANMTFKANLLPNSDLGYSLGSSEQKWKINGVDDPKLSDTTYSAGTALSLSGTTFNVTTVPIANGGTGAITAQNAAWNILHVIDPGDLNTAKRLGMFKISSSTTNTPISSMWGATWNIVDDSSGGNTGTNGSSWQLVFKSQSNDMWLRCITNANSWTDYAKFLSDKNYTDYTVTKTGGGASGTWGISITGHASQDLPLSGGTMTGQIVLASNGYRTSGNQGYSVDVAGNFTHLTNDTSQYWHLNKGTGAATFTVYWETGNTTIAGTVTAPTFIGALTGHASQDLPLSGGTMTGTINMASVGYTTPAASGITTDSSGNFKHKRTTSTDTWNLYNNAGSSTFAHEWETGNLRITGNLTAKNFLPCNFVSSLDANSCSQGFYVVAGSITNAPITYHGCLLYITSVGTPFQIYMPDALNYMYKRWYTSGAWTSWQIMNAAWA